jgi:plastocyanin
MDQGLGTDQGFGTYHGPNGRAKHQVPSTRDDVLPEFENGLKVCATFAPYRARVKSGTPVTWRNNGRMVHTIVAQDGSWTTGPLQTGDVGGVTFDKPGTYTYVCKEHPWAYGQIVVE